MSLAQALSTYFTLNALVLIGFFGLLMLSLFLKYTGRVTKSIFELRLHYATLFGILALALAHPLLPQKEFFQPTVKVWSAQSIKTFAQDFSTPDKGGYLTLPSLSGLSSVSADSISLVWMLLGLILLVSGGIVIGRDIHRLRKIKRRSYCVRKLGRVNVFVNDEIAVPFSYWRPYQINVVLPSSLISRRQEYQMALAHELQHHRQGDTKWVYVLWGLRLVCLLNPTIHFWNKWISEVQEFACDETLVDQEKVESQAYARCLVEVAQIALNQEYVPVCATGLLFLVEGNILKRRIEKMFSKVSTKSGRSISLLSGLLMACLMGATAFASKSFVQDRRVSLAQAKEMAKNAQSTTGFPIVVNDLVLKQLNRYIGTPEGREFMRNSLQRMENYRNVVEGKIQDYGLPLELMAVPIVESGYQNLEQSNNQGWGAGLWMFIVPTARNYGLRVDDKVDERLNVDLLTDAAMRYLESNNLRFKDWLLAALAYNIGENRVQKAIEKTRSKDAWVLIRKGYENDQDYLPRLMAAVLIMKNPESVQ
ncbi:MAG: transglycosylase SLT domain-containing protein [Bdellovibrionales bacterium]|nr:transglycosylase SLT domain-containing protein [Bdellovibrionales bacterium]